MVKKNLKDYLTDDTLDLSLTDLQEVPVKEIAALPKATSLDLSNNKLTTLNKSFGVSLTHLVKLDLARNELKELPKNFGLLVNLKHLDLYKNKLESLPLSFANLKALRWLDLKENPLEPHWRQIVGPCLNAQDCKAAAKNVINFASMVHEEITSELQLSQARLKQQEENEENELREMAKKREKQREKKKRRLAAKTAELANVNATQNGSVKSVEPICPVYEEECVPPLKKKSCNIGAYLKNFCVILFKIFIYFLLIFALVIFVLHFVNEPVYNRIMARLSKHSQSLVSIVPGHTRVELHKMTNKIITNTQMFVFYVWTTSYKSTINAYVFVTSDPKFETYVNTFILNFQYAYVTLCNSVSLIVNTVMQTVPS